jgi:hypothetical protein
LRKAGAGAAVAFAETKSDYTVLHFLEELLVLLNSCSLKPVIWAFGPSATQPLH